MWATSRAYALAHSLDMVPGFETARMCKGGDRDWPWTGSSGSRSSTSADLRRCVATRPAQTYSGGRCYANHRVRSEEGFHGQFPS